MHQSLYKRLSTPAIAILASAQFSCNPEKRETFSSSDIVNSRLAASLSDCEPFFMKIDSANLLCVLQSGDNIRFFRTASGYGDKGFRADLAVAGMSADQSAPNIYTEINFLEVRCFYDENWNIIYKAACDNYRNNPASVDPELLRKVLELENDNTLRDTGIAEYNAKVKLTKQSLKSNEKINDFNPLSMERYTYDPFDTNKKIRRALTEAVMQASGLPMTEISESVYLKIAPEVILKATEVEGKLKFFKTSSGYTGSGGSAHIKGLGLGIENAYASTYSEISKSEALAFLEGDWEKLYRQTLAQSKLIKNSVNPESVLAEFK